MDKESYYEYTGQGSNWWKKDPPALDPWFQKELNLVAGFSDRGQPNLRVVWGGTAMADITERPQLKYKAVREIINGYDYIKTDGTVGRTPSMNLPEDAKVPWEFNPRRERIELGRLRWAIERHVPAHELKRLGRFTHLHAPNGEKILRDLPSEGVYDHFFWVQTARHKYRDLDNEVLTAVKAMYVYDITTSQAQKALDAIEAEQKNILVGAQEARSIFSEL